MYERIEVLAWLDLYGLDLFFSNWRFSSEPQGYQPHFLGYTGPQK